MRIILKYFMAITAVSFCLIKSHGAGAVLFYNNAPANRTVILEQSTDFVAWAQTNRFPGHTAILLPKDSPQMFFRATLVEETNGFSVSVFDTSTINNGLISGHGAPASAPPVVNLNWIYIDLDTGIIYPWNPESEGWIF